MRKSTIVMATLAMTTATPASADWLKATSRHFVVYADVDRASLQRQAVEQERFDAAIRLTFPSPGEDADAEANRVTIYVLPTGRSVNRLIGIRDIAGVYLPRITGSLAFTPRLGNGGNEALSPRIVLQHEHAHHYLFNGKSPSIGQLFALPARLTPEQQDAVYDRGWLLTHYLMFDRDRQGQLNAYLRQLNAGKSRLVAAAEAFGDMRALDRALDAYLTRRMLRDWVRARPLPHRRRRHPTADGGGAGDDRPAHEIDARRRRDERQTALCEGQGGGAIPGRSSGAGLVGGDGVRCRRPDRRRSRRRRRARRRPALQPGAALQGARSPILRARATASPAGWTEARRWIIRANHASNNDAAALALFYGSFKMAGEPPRRSAIAGLYRAIELVPEDAARAF